jgi:hypothetical protein
MSYIVIDASVNNVFLRWLLRGSSSSGKTVFQMLIYVEELIEIVYQL